MDRRKFFFGLAGLAVAPLIPKLLTPTVPLSPARYSYSEMVAEVISSKRDVIASNVARNNALLALLEERIAKAQERMAHQISASMYG